MYQIHTKKGLLHLLIYYKFASKDAFVTANTIARAFRSVKHFVYNFYRFSSIAAQIDPTVASTRRTVFEQCRRGKLSKCRGTDAPVALICCCRDRRSGKVRVFSAEEIENLLRPPSIAYKTLSSAHSISANSAELAHFNLPDNVDDGIFRVVLLPAL